MNYSSGFHNCNQLFDSTGWHTEANMHTDQARTAYRMSYNVPKPFHKQSFVNTHGRLKANFKIYDIHERDTQENWKKVLNARHVLPLKQQNNGTTGSNYLDKMIKLREGK